MSENENKSMLDLLEEIQPELTYIPDALKPVFMIVLTVDLLI